MAFKKNTGDPLVIEAARQAREAEDARISAAMGVLREHYNELSEEERSFFGAGQERLALWLPLTPAQSQWLFSIEDRLTRTDVRLPRPSAPN